MAIQGRTLLYGFALLLAGAAPAQAQSSASEAWFGITLPPGMSYDVPEVILSRPPAPAVVPAGEEGNVQLRGSLMMADLNRIVNFAVESRTSREIGDGGLWGRVTGLPSGNRTVEWAVEEFRGAGIRDVEFQRFTQPETAGLTVPTSWEVRLIADPAFGPGSRDVILESAMPLGGSRVEVPIRAPLVYVGTATPAELAGVDVRGKVAIQRVIPQGHTVFTRDPVGPRGEDLLARGAVAVLNIVDLPGNMRVRDMGCGPGPCFNLGGRDGLFLESVLSAAAEVGTMDRVQVEFRVEQETLRGLSSGNGVAVIPGVSEEVIIINAHADSWFDGAGDNGDGLAVLLALARHFVLLENRPNRTLVLVASAGHHTGGLSGPGNFVSMNPDLVERAVLAINLEHVALLEVTPARSTFPDGYREWVSASYEAPIVAGVTNLSPFLEGLISEGIGRYGTNFVGGPNTMASGEGASYRGAGLTVFTTMQGSPLYHTSGEVREVISEPGLERMARFMAWFIQEVGAAPASQINP